uniref:Odorant binding protein 25 n=1 Tax=Cylas formicarius TaxID=197179 RepID=A0A8T9EBR8_CYLFO|nr:odorant binding protein 25 [Cylas formicarius]
MKILLAVAYLMASVYAETLTPEELSKFKKIREQCMQETAVDPALVKKMQQHQFDEKLKDFLFCTYTRLGYQNEAGEIQGENVKALIARKFNKELADQAEMLCFKMKNTPQDTALAVSKCLCEHAPKDANFDDLF